MLFILRYFFVRLILKSSICIHTTLTLHGRHAVSIIDQAVSIELINDPFLLSLPFFYGLFLNFILLHVSHAKRLFVKLLKIS